MNNKYLFASILFLFMIGLGIYSLLTAEFFIVVLLFLALEVLFINLFNRNNLFLHKVKLVILLVIFLGFLRVIFDFYYIMIIVQILSVLINIFLFIYFNVYLFFDKSLKDIFKNRVVFLCCLISVICLFLLFYNSILVIYPFGISKEKEPYNYDKRIPIWGDVIPFNSSRSKLKDMNIEGLSSYSILSIRFSTAISREFYHDDVVDIDTLTYIKSIKSGYEKTTYEDVPYLIPYLKEGSDKAVIIIPGGAYSYKSIDRSQHEGAIIAKKLNDYGISAFVLWYRSNPYEMPVPLLDVQRAIRYVKYYALDFGIDSSKVSLIGFSAGAYQVGGFINLLQGKDLFLDDYKEDVIDFVDDSVETSAMIYPLLTFEYNVPMLFSVFDEEEVKDSRKRKELLFDYALYNRINTNNKNQFIAYGTNDTVVNSKGVIKYIDGLKNKGISPLVVVAEGAGHAFSEQFYIDQYIEWLKEK